MDGFWGLLAPIFLSALIFALNALLPGRWVIGYVINKDSHEKMRYHLNGMLVFIIMIFLWFILGYFKIVPYDWLYQYRWYGLTGAFILGVIITLAFVLPYRPVRKSFIADLYLGRVENVQLWGGRVDAKMWLYLTGAVILGLNTLSFSAYHLLLYEGQFSPGIFLSAGLLIYFLIDYLIFEEVHLYTYDLFAESVGFKLGWGCLVFYPYFYAVFLWATVDLPDPGTPFWLLSVYVFIFFAGWILSRGANLQKYFFKKYPERSFMWIKPVAISDGDKKLLVNGFWGLSRHINYLGEILMATGIILCTGYPGSIWPWLYPLYYIILLFSRQSDDDKRCDVKYGGLWRMYEKRVPWRIIPFIY